MQLSLELFTFLCTWIAAPGVMKTLRDYCSCVVLIKGKMNSNQRSSFQS